MPIVFQSSTCAARSLSKSTTYTPPWLSPWRLPRTTDVATRMVRARSEVEPELQADGARTQHGHPLAAAPVAYAVGITPAIVDEEFRVLVPDVVDEDRRRPIVGLEPEPQ